MDVLPGEVFKTVENDLVFRNSLLLKRYILVPHLSVRVITIHRINTMNIPGLSS